MAHYFNLPPGYGDLVQLLQYLSLIHIIIILSQLNIWEV